MFDTTLCCTLQHREIYDLSTEIQEHLAKFALFQYSNIGHCKVFVLA